MEEFSILTGSTINRSTEISDSHGSSRNRHHHHHHDTTNNNATPKPPSKFKGVVSQQNGHWGAQIYANHQRIWLGTFKSEKEAAMAYDSAAILLRNGHNSHRNFPWNNLSVLEKNFQSQFTLEAILAMIKDGSYFAKFSECARAQDRENCHHHLAALEVGSSPAPPGVKMKPLFEKELTPSDVSKLNRLVIPKKYAVKYFPQIQNEENHHHVAKVNNRVDDVELVFFDRLMRSWKFRYCYWKSSQSFVFTRGWNRFAKEKGLRHRDRVIFSSYECSDGVRGIQKMCMINVAYYNGGPTMENGGGDLTKMEIRQPSFNDEVGQEEKEEEGDCNEEVKEDVSPPLSSTVVNNNSKGFKLFGVHIIA